MEKFENFIDGSVAVPANPPTLNDSSVVVVEDEVLWPTEERVEIVDHEFETHSFSPANVLGPFV